MSVTDKADSLNASMTAAIATLAAETDAVKQDETFRAWLLSMSRFHRYSWGNQLLIAVQRPAATQVAGFNTWRKLGRFVKKGEKGIGILAPIVRQGGAQPEEGERLELTAKGPRRLAGFRGATVFDVSQTDGEALPPTPQHNATDGGEDLLPRLEAATRALGITLSYEAIPGRTEGYSKGGFIAVEESQPVAAKCGTLAHELAHELLHWGQEERGTKQQRELEAEATAYVILNHYGMTSGSRLYLSGYGITAEMLQASMQVIAGAARRIIEQIEGKATEEGADDAPAVALAEAA